MWEQIQDEISRRWQMPNLPDPVQRVRLLLLNRLLLGAAFLTLLIVPLLINRLIIYQQLTSLPSLCIILFICLLAYNTHWSYSLRLTSFIVAFLVAIAQDLFNNGLLGHARPLILVFALLVIVLIRVRLGVAFGVLGFFVILAVGQQVSLGNIVPNEGTLNGYLFIESWSWLSINITIGLTAFLAVSLLGILIESVKNSLQEEQSLTQILIDRRLELERRVNLRNQGLATSNLISRRISTILNLNELMQVVVDEIQSSYNYYHVQIYLLNDAGYLLLQSGTGQPGLKMLQAGHKIAVGRGLVGQAAETNHSVLVADVTKNPQWLPNRLLLETKSEAAIPIHLDQQVLGVLDVQHHLANGLTEDDIYILEILASQIAVAIQNALLYEQVQQQAQREKELFEIRQKLQTATDIPAVLEIASQELTHLLKAKKTHIHLG